MDFTYTLPLLDNGLLHNVPGVLSILEAFAHPDIFLSQIVSTTPFFVFELFLFGFSLLCFVGIVLLIVRINEMTAKSRKEITHRKVRAEKVKSTRWGIVETHLASDNPAEWKLAIMEADSMLEELVKKLGYPGSTLGEMMKQIEKSDFTTINDAWEAHKVRNYIAHQGSTFLLTKHQANHTIRLYEKVFKEFEYI
jgi:hypothetical protein